MKIKASIAMGIPLMAVVVSTAVYLSLPDPVPRLEPHPRPGDASGVKFDRPRAIEKDADADHAGREASSTAGTLLQKYAESEVERQKEIAAGQRPVFIPPPLALVDPGPEMGLNEAQAGKLAALRQSFIDGLEKLGKDPASPEYLEYWTRQQEHLDDQVRLHLGQDIFLKLSARGLAEATRAEKAGRR